MKWMDKRAHIYFLFLNKNGKNRNASRKIRYFASNGFEMDAMLHVKRLYYEYAIILFVIIVVSAIICVNV